MKDSVVTSPPVLVNYQISPTDLVYLWEDCKRCFYDKVKHGLQLPRSFAPHFTNADRAMRRALEAPGITDLGVGPRFKVICQGGWVESKAISFQSGGIKLSFRGQFDAVVVTENEEIFVVDFKTTTQDDYALMKFRRQLMCYVTALELPAQKSTMPNYVDGMALLVFDPAHFVFRKEKKVGGLYGTTRWIELPRRNDQFDAFLSEVAALLFDPFPPPAGEQCSVCRLRLLLTVSAT